MHAFLSGKLHSRQDFVCALFITCLDVYHGMIICTCINMFAKILEGVNCIIQGQEDVHNCPLAHQLQHGKA